MTVESATYINQLNAALPGATDPKSEGDDHIRLVKTTVKATFPNVTGAVTPTHTELNYVAGVTSALQTQLNAKAPTASPTLTGAVVLPATTTIGTVTGTELGYLSGVTSALQTQLNAKAALASPALTGTPTAPTAVAGTNTTQIATTAFVATNYAPLASPALTGTPTAPTAAAGTSSTQVATTAFVAATAFSSALPAQTGNAGKYVTTNGTTASWASLFAAQQQDYASSATWTKPTGASFVMVELWGAGSGGASGQRGASLSARGGGGGGGGGAYVYRLFKASELPSTVPVTIGLGGNGGAAITTDNTNGAAGSIGGDSTFGTWMTAYGAGAPGSVSSGTGNGGGGGGTQGAGNNTAGGAPGTGSSSGAAFGGGNGSSSSTAGVSSAFGGGGGGASLSTGTPSVGGVSSWGGAGGSGGGAINTSDTSVYVGADQAFGYFGQGGAGGYAMLSLSNYTVADIAFGNSTFVAVGLQSHILTSSNGTSWTFVPAVPFNTFLGVLYDGARWVAWINHTVWTSTNLTTWTRMNRQQLPVNSFLWIAHNAGTYVAVGTSGSVLTSTDLISWTSQTTGATNQLEHVIHDGTRWVAVGSGDVITSTNATTWTRYAAPFTFSRVSSNGSVLIASGSGANMKRSTDAGATWSNPTTTTTSAIYRCLIYANGQFVAGSSGGLVATSPDGNTWTMQTSGIAESMNGIAYGAGLYVIGSNALNSNAVISSPNGTAWTTRTATAYGPTSTAGWPGAIGCGGGGGGASLNGTASGAGGAGGNGYCRVYSW